jgi:hypothetical protein
MHKKSDMSDSDFVLSFSAAAIEAILAQLRSIRAADDIRDNGLAPLAFASRPK